MKMLLQKTLSLWLKNISIRNLTAGGIEVPLPLRSRKAKSNRKEVKHFVDVKRVRAIAGSGGNGCVSFLQLWANERAGPDGGDGGNGGHVILQACTNIKDLNHVKTVLKAESGEKGFSKDCHGKNASHTIVKVPQGTLVRGRLGEIVADLEEEGSAVIIARGGAGGRGNSFFTSDTNQSPEIAQYGASGEDLIYTLELRTIASFGLLGMPNAGKSSLLQAMTRARPKVAPYPFTTLKPHVGILHYQDYTQIAVADLPGLIEGSHQNRGLGVEFLRHAERCRVLGLVVDAAAAEPASAVALLRHEAQSFSTSLAKKPWLVIANKIDLPDAKVNLTGLVKELKDTEVIPVSAKYGINVTKLLLRIRQLYDETEGKAD